MKQIVKHSWLKASAVLTAILFITFGLCSSMATAQDYRAKLTVTVVDSSGAAVPNASLTLTRGSTHAISTAATDAVGLYTFLFLEPDVYSVRVSAPSFQPAELTSIGLQSYAATNVTIALKVGAATAEVTVTTSATVLQTDTASRAWTLGHQEIDILPVPNGNPVMLGQDAPGVYMRPLGIYTDPWTVTSQYEINGGLIGQNEFQLDGSPNDAELGSNTYGYTPPSYSVKEFTVSSNNYDAEYGHTSGGVINLTTLSGTDKIHGMGWSSFRRTDWNANLSQNKYLNAINNVTTNTRPLNTQTQLGGQVGGPLVIPHLIPRSSKIKPFYFVSFDHYAELLPRGLLLSYPTAKMRTGDFSELLNDPTGYQAITIYDPTTTALASNGHYTRTAFPGNIIPASRINPVAAAVAKLLPAVGSSPAGQREGVNNLSIPNNSYNWHFHNWLGRLDANIGDRYKLSLRPYAESFTEVSNAGGIVGFGENGGVFGRDSKGFLVDLVATLNNSTVVNVRYGYSFFRVPWKSSVNQGADLLTGLGLPSSFVNQLQVPALFGNPSFGWQGYNVAGWFANTEDTGTRTIEGSITKSAGKQNIRAGADIRFTHFTYINPGSFSFTSNQDFTSFDWSNSNSTATSGDGFATFLLGTPSTGNTNINATETLLTDYFAPWVQDDWKVTNKLTLNLGFRWDVVQAPRDRYNALDGGWDPNITNAAQSQIPASTIAMLPQASNLTGGLVFPGVGSNPRSPFPTVYGNVQPRFGMSWQVADNLVVRGGYGVFYTNFPSNNFIQQLGFSASSPLSVSNDGQQTPIANVLSNPYPSGLIQPSGSAKGTLTGIGQTITSFNRNFKVPDVNEFSFGLQYRVAKNSVIDASYVGNRGVNLASFSYDQNMPNWSFLQTCDEYYASGNNANCTVGLPNPFKGLPAWAGTTVYTATTQTAFNLNRPHPEFAAVNTNGFNGGHSWYNAFQINFRQRMTHGLTLNTSYVWSKQILQSGWMNQALNIVQRSVYGNGLPQSFKISGTYELPIGRGRLINLQNKVTDSLLGGWRIAPNFIFESGEPTTLPTNAYALPHNKFRSNLNWHANQVQAYGNCALSKLNGVITIPGGNTGATATRCGTDMGQYDWVIVPLLENEVVNPTNSSQVRMKPTIASDLALEKEFKVERVALTFRAQATNALNHFNLLTARFDNNPNDGANFGTVYPGQTPTADSPPRNINLSLKGSF
jgi:hypothetical protein